MLQVGMTYTVEQTVTTDMTARAIGSGGLEVFGTPFMMAMMESAAMLCVEITSSHVAPTPVGMKVRATAEVTHISENGKLIDFKVTAFDEEGLIGEGTHRRAIISNERFLQKCNDKRDRVK